MGNRAQMTKRMCEEESGVERRLMGVEVNTRASNALAEGDTVYTHTRPHHIHVHIRPHSSPLHERARIVYVHPVVLLGLLYDQSEKPVAASRRFAEQPLPWPLCLTLVIRRGDHVVKSYAHGPHVVAADGAADSPGRRKFFWSPEEKTGREQGWGK